MSLSIQRWDFLCSSVPDHLVNNSTYHNEKGCHNLKNEINKTGMSLHSFKHDNV